MQLQNLYFVLNFTLPFTYSDHAECTSTPVFPPPPGKYDSFYIFVCNFKSIYHSVNFISYEIITQSTQ